MSELWCDCKQCPVGADDDEYFHHSLECENLNTMDTDDEEEDGSVELTVVISVNNNVQI